MRKLILPLCAVALIAGGAAGCKRKKPTSYVIEEPAAAAAPAVGMGDEKLAGQLLKGFYGVENGAWRWTGPNFAVKLQTPPAARATGARLVFKFVTAEAVLKQVKSQTLTASIAGKTLPAVKYNTAGPQEYIQDVPAAALGEDAVTVEFTVDKALPAGAVDRRELALIAVSAALEVK
jgi:hypothetical protein